MSLSRRAQLEKIRQQQVEDFRAGILRDLAEQGPDYPIKQQFFFRPDFFPGLIATRFKKSALQDQDKNRSLPPHQI